MSSTAATVWVAAKSRLLAVPCTSRKDKRRARHSAAASGLLFSRRHVAAYVPVITSFATRMSSLFCVVSSSSSSSVPSKLQRTIIYRHQWTLVLSNRLPSLTPSSGPTCSHARITPSSMLGMSRGNTAFDLQLGRSTSDSNNLGLLSLDRFVVSAFIHASLQKNEIPYKFAASSPVIAQEGGCEPYPHSPSDLPL